jgi:hypothetical protein
LKECLLALESIISKTTLWPSYTSLSICFKTNKRDKKGIGKRTAAIDSLYGSNPAAATMCSLLPVVYYQSSHQIPLICEVMKLPDWSEKACIILDKLATNEESIAKLYRGYADAFPILREFWSSLASEEVNHTSCIRSLGGQIGTLSVFMDEDRFNAIAIQTFTGYLDTELSRLNEEEIPLIEALSITLYIEQSLIESKFFEVFKADSAEVQHTLAKLRDETLAHRNRAKETLEKYKHLRRV